MLIKCIFNSGKNLPLDARCLDETDETDYSFLEIGKEYTVYGLMFFSCRVDYLVCHINDKPDWLPSNLFEVVDNQLPSGWSICMTYSSEEFKPMYDYFKILSLISYPKLVTSFSHYTGIIEREPEDLSRFFLEKKKIDEQIAS